MMRGGVPWLLHEFPDVVDQKIVKSADLFLENFIGLHYRSHIAIVDAVKWIELNGVTLEMPGQEGVCYFLMPHVVPAGALYVIEEHREMRHVKTVGQHVVHELVDEYLVNTILAGRLHRPDSLGLAVFPDNQIMLVRHSERFDAFDLDGHLNGALTGFGPDLVEDSPNVLLEEVSIEFPRSVDTRQRV